ncbi:acid phosphatase [Allosaccharopolyspora coralli]|uniref:Acid phosphatase n=1 Tax=Allosaccharopolyspora coralli TaxID=2665642 RepID=A0A5Q3Q995_9PSEU|nr:acid phosphatase [Allosaccharopolyspora coralli]QGK71261.1 acid phosphatase [Allosaccharopolyspora coralli]
MPEHRIHLLRHGPTEWSLTGRHTGRTDVPLTESGEASARRAGRTLAEFEPLEATVLTSPRSRATRTAELAGLAGAESWDLLAEWDYGDYEGLTTPQIRTEVPDWTVWTHPCPGGETAAEVGDRADAVLGEIEALRRRGAVVLVGHGHFSRALVARWLGLPAAEGVRFALDPAGISVLGHERGVRQLTHSNVPPEPRPAGAQ